MDLIQEALTHSSFAFEHGLPYDNERLEFLGDAVLGLVATEFLYTTYPHSNEGVLAKYKSQIVSRAVLGKRAEDMGIGELILLGKGEEQNGGRTRLALLGSALEAIVGALYLDLGLQKIMPFLREAVFEPAHQISTCDEFGDYKSLLQELVQKEFQTTPVYTLVGESGPDHNKSFEVVVHVRDELLGRGIGRRKKSAENEAAMKAYWLLVDRENSSSCMGH
jgi:ribonuclease-3